MLNGEKFVISSDCLFNCIGIFDYFFPYRDEVNRKGIEASLECPGAVIIDAGEYVRSIAFGSRSSAEIKNSRSTGGRKNSIFRYLVFNDVVLVTGLCNGRIRTWDVKTGSLISFSYMDISIPFYCKHQ